MLDTIGYVVAAALAAGAVLGIVLTLRAMSSKQKLKGVSLQPWKVDFQFYDKDDE